MPLDILFARATELDIIKYILIIIIIKITTTNYYIVLGPHPVHMEVPRLGVESEYSCQSTPQP